MILGLIVVGIGQGALMTLLLNVLVTAVPKDLAGDVGSLRGVIQNLSTAVGTAVMGTLLVGLLSVLVRREMVDKPLIPPELKRAELTRELDLENINFVRNDDLKERLAQTSAGPETVAEGVRINTEARLRSLKIGFLLLSGLALLATVPCRWLPNYEIGEIPDVEAEETQ